MKKFNEKLSKFCKEKNNRLCLGLDVDNSKLKNSSLKYLEDYIVDIIDNTIDLCPIYKVNFAFYERFGSDGFKILEKINSIINGRAISIADAKRGDIGNSSKFYADAIFNFLEFDSITVSPYMGLDSIEPFIQYKDKGIFVLCLTSNKGSEDFQMKISNNKEIYKYVIDMAIKNNYNNNLGLVIGATNKKYLKEIKSLSGNLPWLMPGVGFQGGDLKESISIGEKNGIAIINVSRGILNAGNRTINDIRKATKIYTEQIRAVL